MTRRPTHAMPQDVAEALTAGGVRDAYDARPPFQRNDYIGWITDAKTGATRRKRIDRMVEELTEGGVYMGMPHAPSRKA